MQIYYFKTMNRVSISSYQYHLCVMVFTVLTSVSLNGQNPVKIMPLGNSITRGETDGTITVDQMKGYRYYLNQLLTTAGYSTDFVGSESSGCGFFNDCQHAGIGGTRDQYVARLLTDGYDERNGVQILVPPRPYLDEYNPDIILLHIGTNDITHEPDAITNQQVSTILNLIDQYEIRAQKEVIVFLALIINRKIPCTAGSGCQTTTDFNNYIKTMALVRIASGDKIVIVDMEHDAGFNYDNSDMSDNLHPNSIGYSKMANLWYSSITSNFNTGPVIAAIPDQNLNEGESSSPLSLDDYISDFEDPDQDISWSAVQLGTEHLNIVIDANRQVIVTPMDPEWNGSESVVFTATDKGKNNLYVKFATDTVVYTVNPVNDPPVFTSTPALTVDKGQQYIYSCSATDEDVSDILTYSAPLIPSWLTFYPGSKLLVGIPQHIGTFDITLSVSDGYAIVDQTFSINVTGSTEALDNESSVVNIYPNPASDHIMIRLKDGADDFDFTLFDLTGALIFHHKICNTFEAEINLRQHNIPDGVYLYKILSSKEALTGKLLIYNK